MRGEGREAGRGGHKAPVMAASTGVTFYTVCRNGYSWFNVARLHGSISTWRWSMLEVESGQEGWIGL
jgi:hypothetical protein